MKKILLIILAVLVAGGLVAFMVIKQQSGYTKVLTASVVRQDLSTVVSGLARSSQTYVNLGATAMAESPAWRSRKATRFTRADGRDD